MDRPQGKSTTSINLLQILCFIIIFLTLKQINLNAVNSAILELLSIYSLTGKSFTILLGLLIFSFYSFYELYWKRRFLPPGPVPWLVAGNMPQGGGFLKLFQKFLQFFYMVHLTLIYYYKNGTNIMVEFLLFGWDLFL